MSNQMTKIRLPNISIIMTNLGCQDLELISLGLWQSRPWLFNVNIFSCIFIKSSLLGVTCLDVTLGTAKVTAFITSPFIQSKIYEIWCYYVSFHHHRCFKYVAFATKYVLKKVILFIIFDLEIALVGEQILQICVLSFGVCIIWYQLSCFI